MNGKRRVLSVILVLVMVFSLVSANVFADNEQVNHVNGCGYVCTHEHDSECGYVAASDCKHVHGEDCSYVKEEKCNCLPDNDGNIVHEDNCGYVAPVECDHVHNSDCGFVEGSRCTHGCADDENCKWVDARGCEAFVPTYVAQIGEEKYETLDEAIKAAKGMSDDSVVITLLANCETSEILLKNKNITIQGSNSETVTFVNRGICLTSASLTFDACNVVFDSITKEPLENRKMPIVISGGAKLNVSNGTTMTIQNVSCGIYACGATEVNVSNGSTLNLLNCKDNGFSRENKTLDKIIVSGNSALNIQNSRSSFTGSFGVYIENSALNVIDNLGNASNGASFVFTNAVVNFKNVSGHAISASSITSTNSSIVVDNAGYCGIVTTNLDLVASSVEVSNTKGKLYWVGGIRLKGIGNVDSNSTLYIHNNDATGIFVDTNAQLNIADGANVVVTNNSAYQANYSTFKELARCGGGLVVRAGASANLSASTKIYNNHAALAGDDIFLEDGASIVLPAVASSVSLDDCGHAITGWYYDGYRATDEIDVPEFAPQATNNVAYKIDFSRWNVITSTGKNCNNQDDTYAVALENQQGQMNGVLAIKAAHGPVNDTPIVINIVPAGDPVEDIPEDDVPQTDLPTEEDPSTPAGEETIPDEDAPLADAPSAVTGDATVIWLAIAMVCGMSLIYIVADSKRKED